MPKTYRNLWPQLASFENLWLAYLAARRGKRARPAVAAYDLDAETRLLRLQERLEAGEYAPGAYRTFVIREWKRRVVSAAPFEDRIVHHALCNVIEPIWEARFIHDTYACRVGKGTLAALQAADEALHELRVLLRQGQALQLLTLGQYEHVARLLDEVGRLIGGWRKSLARAATGGMRSEQQAMEDE